MCYGRLIFEHCGTSIAAQQRNCVAVGVSPRRCCNPRIIRSPVRGGTHRGSSVATSWLWNALINTVFRGLTPPGYKMPPLRGYEKQGSADLRNEDPDQNVPTRSVGARRALICASWRFQIPPGRRDLLGGRFNGPPR